MSLLTLNGAGGGPTSAQPLQAQTTKSQSEPSKESQATQPTTSPQDIAKQLAKPVDEAGRSETVGLLAGRSEITSQMVEQRLTKAADELSHARNQAARITSEMQAEGLIPADAPGSERGADSLNKGLAQADAMTREKVENAFTQARELGATQQSPTTSLIV